MTGKVKFVRRETGLIESSSDHWSSIYHPERVTRTWAQLYNGDEVDIEEEQIRDFYGM